MAEDFLVCFDRFVSGIFKHKSDVTDLIICSDHGNIEDLSIGSHTLNPALLLAAGPSAYLFHKAGALTHIAGIIMSILKDKKFLLKN